MKDGLTMKDIGGLGDEEALALYESQNQQVKKYEGQNVTPKSPQVGYYPAAVNQGNTLAKMVWDINILKQAHAIFRYDNVGRQWATAVAIYKRSCAKRNIPAFGR